MLRTEFNHLLAFGSLEELAGAGQLKNDPSISFDGDVFLKKAEAWAYRPFFLSTLNEVEEIQGRFAVVPMDSLVMDYLEIKVAPSNRLPTGHLYGPAIHELMESLATALNTTWDEDAGDALELLDRDLALRSFLLERRLEHFYS